MIQAGPVALLLGASSAIAEAIARELAVRGYVLVLCGRDSTRLHAVAQRLRDFGASVRELPTVDLADLAAVGSMFEWLREEGCRPALVLVAQGIYRSNAECLHVPAEFRRMVDTNLCSAVYCAVRALELFDTRRGGELVVVSSVSGDRGRARNHFYGATRAGLDCFLEGLRQANAGSQINVMTLKPGPMVSGAAAVPGERGFLRASPAVVARVACAALGRRRAVVYAPRWWRPVMWLVRWLPGGLLARMRI